MVSDKQLAATINDFHPTAPTAFAHIIYQEAPGAGQEQTPVHLNGWRKPAQARKNRYMTNARENTARRNNNPQYSTGSMQYF